MVSLNSKGVIFLDCKHNIFKVGFYDQQKNLHDLAAKLLKAQ